MQNIIQAVFSPGAAQTPIDRVLRFSVIGLALTLGTALAFLTFSGHGAFNTSSGVPWGLPVSMYLFLVLAATGLTFVAALSILFGFQDFAPVAKRCTWLSVAALIGGFTALGLEIGHPFRMIWTLPSGMQYVSPMFWMGLFYTLYFVLLLGKFQRIHAGDWHSPLSHALGLAFVRVGGDRAQHARAGVRHDDHAPVVVRRPDLDLLPGDGGGERRGVRGTCSPTSPTISNRRTCRRRCARSPRARRCPRCSPPSSASAS